MTYFYYYLCLALGAAVGYTMACLMFMSSCDDELKDYRLQRGRKNQEDACV